MLKAFANCWKVPELRNRIIVSLGLLFVARLGANIPLPGLDTEALRMAIEKVTSGSGGNAVAIYNMFTGGAMMKGAVFALGVMPYISASIIMQLMGAVVPAIAKMQQDGESGRQKVAQYSRYLTIAIAFVQALMMLLAMIDPTKAAALFGFQGEVVDLVVAPTYLFVPLGLFLLVSGSMIVLWLGEQITERGIGNGTSMLITLGILADFPAAVTEFTSQMGSGVVGEAAAKYNWFHAVGMVLLFVVVTAALVAITQAVRRVPIQYAKRIIGKKIYGGQSSYLPLKLTYAGVMPVIFAGAILSFPSMIFRPIAANFPSLGFLNDVAAALQHGGSVWFYIFYGMMIVGFSYFWVAMMFKPTQIADDLKKANGFIPGIHPGKNTALFLKYVMNRLLFVGSFTLLLIALLPDIFAIPLGFPWRLAALLGGTGGLITVGVALDTMRQVETMLLQRHYEGFLKKGRIGNLPVPPSSSRKVVDFGGSANIGLLGYSCLTIFVLGLAARLLEVL